MTTACLLYLSVGVLLYPLLFLSLDGCPEQPGTLAEKAAFFVIVTVWWLPLVALVFFLAVSTRLR